MTCAGCVTALGAVAYAGHAELYLTDGTSGGTPRLAELGNYTQYGGLALATAGSRLVFTGYDPWLGVQPWASDGTAVELWASDGTAGSAVELLPGRTGSGCDFWRLGSAVAARGLAFVSRADDGPEPGVRQLWATDGTPGGTRWRFDFPAELSDLQAIAALGEDLYFAARVAAGGLRYFRSDGTPDGTLQISDIGPQELPPNYYGYPFLPPRFTRVGDDVFYALCRDSGPCGLCRSRRARITRTEPQRNRSPTRRGPSLRYRSGQALRSGRQLQHCHPERSEGSRDGHTGSSRGR